MTRASLRRVAIAVALVTAGLGAAIAMRTPADAAKAPPVPAPPAAPAPIRFLTADSVSLGGRWYAAPDHAPVLVLAPRRRGPDAEIDTAAAQFQKRGFHVLVFELRDPAPESRERDSLRYAVLVSHWVDDLVAAFHAARARTDSTTHVYGWGQRLGGALVVAAAAREPGLCDAIAAEDFFPNVDWAMRQNGTAVIPDAVKLQYRVLRGADEPFSAAARLNLPVFAVLDGPDAGTPGDLAGQALRRNRGRTDRWIRPGVASPAPIPRGGEYDTLATWFRRWDSFPRTH